VDAQTGGRKCIFSGLAPGGERNSGPAHESVVLDSHVMSGPEFETVLYENDTWLKPVEAATDLPVVDVADGSVCYVHDENRIYQFVSGVWVIKAGAAGDSDS